MKSLSMVKIKLNLFLFVFLSSASLTNLTFASTPEDQIMNSKTLRGLMLGIEADHSMKCGGVERIQFYVDQSSGFLLSKFKAYMVCKGLTLNEEGDRPALGVEVIGVVGDGTVQVETMKIEWAG